MAKYTIDHACGHQGIHDITGPERERPARQSHIAERECPDCQNATRARTNVASAQGNSEAGMPPLTGSEKQVAWAESIRADICWRTEEWIALMVEKAVKARTPQSELEQGEARYRSLYQKLREMNQASWWIDNRSGQVPQILKEMEEKGSQEKREI